MAQTICIAKDCDWPAAIKGRCHAHHEQFERGRPEGPIKRRTVPNRVCEVDDCSKIARGRLCSMHTARKARLGVSGPAASQRPGGGRIVTSQGYVRVHRPDHPRAKTSSG